MLYIICNAPVLYLYALMLMNEEGSIELRTTQSNKHGN